MVRQLAAAQWTDLAVAAVRSLSNSAGDATYDGVGSRRHFLIAAVVGAAAIGLPKIARAITGPKPSAESKGAMMSAKGKVLAIGRLNAPPTSERILEILPREVPATLRLYLEGHIEQFWAQEGNIGVVFVLSATSVAEARTLLNELPLTKAGLMIFEYLPIGPLAPLSALLKEQ